MPSQLRREACLPLRPTLGEFLASKRFLGRQFDPSLAQLEAGREDLKGD